jgi:hypothetical protein
MNRALIKKKRIFPHILGIQKGSVAKSNMTYSLLIYGLIFGHFIIGKEALLHI